MQAIAKGRPTRVLACVGRWRMGGGLASTAACRVGLLCRALAGTGGQRPVNSMLHHDGMHASQIPRVQGGGLPPRTLPACACEHAVQARRATNRESGAPGGSEPRPDYVCVCVCSLDTCGTSSSIVTVSFGGGGGPASHHRSDFIAGAGDYRPLGQ